MMGGRRRVPFSLLLSIQALAKGAAFGAMADQYVFGDCTSSKVYIAALNGTRDDIAGTRARVPQCVVCCHAGTQQRRD